MASRAFRRRVKQMVLWAEILFILLLGAGVGIVGGAFYQIRKILPPEDHLNNFRPVQGTKIYSSDGVLLAKMAHEDRELVPIDKIPLQMQQAVIAIEDERFYQHSGLDFRGLARAVWQNLRGGVLTQQGGSTITQQLARNIYLSQQKTLSRKLKETMLAVQIERNWSKRQILEMYLNQVYFGSRAYGIQSAAKVYFGKDVGKLSLAECALLAGLPQRPSRLSPYRNQEAAIRRRNLVLDKMADLGFIPEQRAEQAKRQPVRLAHAKEPQLSAYYRAPYFVSYVVEYLRDTYGDDLIYKGGLNVVTSLHWKMQQAAETALIEGVQRNRHRNIHDGALVCIDPHTGYIRAMVGGVDFAKDQFNIAVQARRQPGSAFKLFVYTAAIDSRGWRSEKIVSARSPSVKQADGSVWTVKSHSKRRHGSLPILQAFAYSDNPAAVNTLIEVGASTVVDYAQRLGVKSPMRPYPSLALGASEVTPLEITSAYGVMAANGIRAEPIAVRLIKSRDGEVMEENSPRLHRVKLQPETIATMNQLTRAVVQSGTGRAAGVVANAHGKTGTTDDYTDVWFIGYTPDLATGVWLGNRDNSRMRRSYGGDVAAPIWAAFMREAVKLNPKMKRPSIEHLVAADPRAERKARAASMREEEPRQRAAEAPATDRSEPESRDQPAEFPDGVVSGDDGGLTSEVTANANNVVRVRVCDESYDLATARCDSTRVLEFVSGMQPRQICPIHGARPRPPAPKPPAARPISGEVGQ